MWVPVTCFSSPFWAREPVGLALLLVVVEMQESMSQGQSFQVLCVLLTGIPLAQARSRDELKAK